MAQRSGQRTDGSTGGPTPVFETAWPELAARLKPTLLKRGATPTQAEDVTQETGLRLWRIWLETDHSRPVWPLAVTIALNVLRDQERRDRRLIVTDVVPDAPEPVSVEDEGMARLELHRVAQAIRTLQPAHRSALLDHVESAGTRRAPRTPAEKMMLMRARRRLHAALGTVSAAIFGIVLRLRRSTFATGSQAVGAMAAVALVLALPGTPQSVQAARGPAIARAHTIGTVSSSSPTRTGARTAGVASSIWRGGTPGRTGTDGGSTGPATPRPVHVHAGGADAWAWAEISVGNISAQIGDHGGQVPACVAGSPALPRTLSCRPSVAR